jgi:hypothetical protein
MTDMHAAALEFLDRGWSVIPISAETKRPLIKWLEFQRRHATPEEVDGWFETWPNALLAVVCGEISGVVVVDADNPDAEQYALAHGLAHSPVQVTTKRGRHYYYKHPMDGHRRGPRAGVNVRQVAPDWPAIDGLDFRGDGSYALIPPSKNYAWAIQPGIDIDDDMPVWNDWVPPVPRDEQGGFDFAALDLSTVPTADSFVSEWDRTAQFVREKFPTSLKIPTGGGNGRNERVLRYASECLVQGHWGPQLRLKVIAFMREFFVDPLDEREFEATCASVEQMERRNHPERFNERGEYVFKPAYQRLEEHVQHKRRLIYAKDAQTLIKESAARQYLIEPWLRKGTIVQVYAYSGHGKSMLVTNALYALACGHRHFGPWEMPSGAARTLYLDYENGPGTIGTRLASLEAMFGDAADRFAIWTPFVEEGEEMNLRSQQGVNALEGWVKWYNPDIVVIDTVRSAFPGLQENDAAEWSNINTLAIKLRNAGYAVIIVHHSNKPGEDGLGREAGSTNQLTVLETQIRITQVFEDKDTAHQNAGRFDGDYDNPVWPQLTAKLPIDFTVNMVVEVRYGKVREWTDLHDRVQWVGWASHNSSDDRMVVSSTSTKQKAKSLALNGHSVYDIAVSLRRPVRTIEEWLGLAHAPTATLPPGIPI